MYAEDAGVTLNLLPMLVGFLTYKVAIISRQAKQVRPAGCEPLLLLRHLNQHSQTSCALSLMLWHGCQAGVGKDCDAHDAWAVEGCYLCSGTRHA